MESKYKQIVDEFIDNANWEEIISSHGADDAREDICNLLEKVVQNETIEFAEWIAQYQYEQDFDTKLWCYWDNGLSPKDEYTTEELFKIYKRERNGTTYSK